MGFCIQRFYALTRVLPHGLFIGGFNEMRRARDASREAARLRVPKRHEKNFPHSCYRVFINTVLKLHLFTIQQHCSLGPGGKRIGMDKEGDLKALLERAKELKEIGEKLIKESDQLIGQYEALKLKKRGTRTPSTHHGQ